MRNIKRLNRLVVLMVMLGAAIVFAEGEGPCFVLNWDIVTGGSNINTPHPGECEYEIDIENVNGNSTLGFNIPQEFVASREHWLGFKFRADRFNRNFEGHFRILSLLAGESEEPIFSIDLYWGQLFSREGDLFLEAKAYSAPSGPFLNVSTIAMTPALNNATEAFSHQISVAVKLTESSEPKAADGSIELWVEGELVATAFDMDFDWSFFHAPQAVQFGVVEVFAPTSSGKLKITPVQPAPYNTDF